MRRIAVTCATFALTCALAAIAGCGQTASDGYQVTAVFDSARGVLTGGPVKVAGADVGNVTGISVTPDRKARVQMQIQMRFAPFRADASCQIRSAGLIGERYVECNPGIPGAAPAQPGTHAFVALSHTTVPIDLSDFFDIWALPVQQRFTILLDELGIATAGRGDDLNALLRRANPALVKADAVLAILDRQRQQLSDLVGSTDVALRDLAARGPDVRSLIREAAGTFTVTALHAQQLRTGIAGLPTLLTNTRASLLRLDGFSAATVPVLDDLQAAAPRLTQLVRSVPAFAGAALPALAHLSPALNRTRRALGHAEPVTRQLESFASSALPTGRLLDELLVSARQSGAVDYLNELNYFLASATSRYDLFTHVLPAALLTFSNCQSYATTPAGGDCQGTFTTPPASGAAGRTRGPASKRRTAAHQPSAAANPAASPPGTPGAPSSSPASPLPSLVPPLPGVPPVRSPVTLPGLLNYLLH